MNAGFLLILKDEIFIKKKQLFLFIFHLKLLFFNIFKFTTLKVFHAIKRKFPESLRSLAEKIKIDFY